MNKFEQKLCINEEKNVHPVAVSYSLGCSPQVVFVQFNFAEQRGGYTRPQRSLALPVNAGSPNTLDDLS